MGSSVLNQKEEEVGAYDSIPLPNKNKSKSK